MARSKEMSANGRRLDNTIARERAAYDAHRSTMTARDWNRLVERADRVWAEAHEATDASGVEYTARDGTIRCKREQNDTWVGRTLSYYQRALRDNI